MALPPALSPKLEPNGLVVAPLLVTVVPVAFLLSGVLPVVAVVEVVVEGVVEDVVPATGDEKVLRWI